VGGRHTAGRTRHQNPTPMRRFSLDQGSSGCLRVQRVSSARPGRAPTGFRAWNWPIVQTARTLRGDKKWPLETAEKRTGLEFRLRCGEVGRPAVALHFASGLHAALRYLLRSGTRASVLKTSSSLEECWTSGRKGICGRSPERTQVAPTLVSWHRRVTSDLFEPDIGR